MTPGTLGTVRGPTLIISNGFPVHQIPAAFSFLGDRLSNGSDLLGINPYLKQAIIGAVII